MTIYNIPIDYCNEFDYALIEDNREEVLSHV